jgi:hypothetical protein
MAERPKHANARFDSDAFRAAIIEALAYRKTTYAWLADRTGVTPNGVKSIITGRTRDPHIDIVVSICYALDWTVDEFTHRTSPRPFQHPDTAQAG